MPVRGDDPAGRGQPQRLGGDPALRRRERGARAARRQPACREPASRDLPAERGDDRPRPSRRRRHGADPASRRRLDPDRRHRSAQRPRARGLAGRGDRGRRRGLPREADREPEGVPGVRARRAARRRRPGAAPTSASLRSTGAPRCARRSRRTCAAPAACSPRRCRRATRETVAYCAQFLGSVGEMLGDRDLAAAARGAAEPGGTLVLAGLLDRRLGAGRKVA